MTKKIYLETFKKFSGLLCFTLLIPQNGQTYIANLENKFPWSILENNSGINKN